MPDFEKDHGSGAATNGNGGFEHGVSGGAGDAARRPGADVMEEEGLALGTKLDSSSLGLGITLGF